MLMWQSFSCEAWRIFFPLAYLFASIVLFLVPSDQNEVHDIGMGLEHTRFIYWFTTRSISGLILACVKPGTDGSKIIWSDPRKQDKLFILKKWLPFFTFIHSVSRYSSAAMPYKKWRMNPVMFHCGRPSVTKALGSLWIVLCPFSKCFLEALPIRTHPISWIQPGVLPAYRR